MSTVASASATLKFEQSQLEQARGKPPRCVKVCGRCQQETLCVKDERPQIVREPLI